jgi:hypothetical protein
MRGLHAPLHEECADAQALISEINAEVIEIVASCFVESESAVSAHGKETNVLMKKLTRSLGSPPFHHILDNV